MVTIELFTSPTCPYCPPAREIVYKVAMQLEKQGEDVTLNEYNVYAREGSVKASEYGITHVPEIVIYNNPEKKIIMGETPSYAKLEKAIRVAQGKEPMPEKKSLFSKIKNKIGL